MAATLPLPITPLAHPPPMQRRMRIEMGTALVIEARAPSSSDAAAAVTAAFATAARLVRCLDPWTRESDLWRINHAIRGKAVSVRTATLEVLRFAQHLSRLSDGFFDPCLPTRRGCVTDLELIEGAQPHVIAHQPLELDCGGIAKGYIVDAAISELRNAGCCAGLVNAGGDARTFGAGCGQMLVRGPAGVYRSLPPGDTAVAVSERDSPRAPRGHRGYYVRTGKTVARAFAAVRAADAMTADALTKCLLLAPAGLNESLLREFHSESLA
jgi:FAD:protein FMN transferase